MSMFSGGELAKFPLDWRMRLTLGLAIIGVLAILALGGWALFAFVITHLRWT